MKSLITVTLASVLFACSNAYPDSVRSAQRFDHSRELRSEYDYIIVGGGTSGLTVADRLTENAKGWGSFILGRENSG